jgi:hypothetical protein
MMNDTVINDDYQYNDDFSNVTRTNSSDTNEELVWSIVDDDYAAIMPRITGGLSAVSSALIIYIILKSEVKLNSIYHRIVFGMSCLDVLGSIAMGLTTLPMPKDPLPSDMVDFRWKGTRLGTVETCEAQAFLVLFGNNCMMIYNGSLILYNACVIAFQMREETILKYVEPILHFLPLAIGLAGAIFPLPLDLYNPTGWDPWCSLSLTHKDDASPEELRNLISLDTFVTVTLSILLLHIFTCLSLIILRVAHTERILIRRNNNIIRRNRRLHPVRLTHQNTKVVLVQAIAYIASFLLTLSFPIVRAVTNEGPLVIRLSFFFLPLQGFYNALIFISHKIYNYRRIHGDVSRCHVLRMLVTEQFRDELLFSRISLIRIHENRAKREMELEVTNENHETQQYHINIDDSEDDTNNYSVDADMSFSHSSDVEFSGGDNSAARFSNSSAFSFSRGSEVSQSVGGKSSSNIMSVGGLSGLSTIGEKYTDDDNTGNEGWKENQSQ